jgi:multiple sugar transport system permease protein
MTDAVKEVKANRDGRLDRAMAWDSPCRAAGDALPAARRCFLFVLLFPFYWMGGHRVQAERGAATTTRPTTRSGSQADAGHIKKLLFETDYPAWLVNTMTVAVIATFLSIFASVLAAYAIERLRFKGASMVGLAIFLAYLVPPRSCSSRWRRWSTGFGLFDTRWALILTYPTFLIPFCTWLLMGYFKSIPYELEECALIDGATRWQILTKITLPLAVPGLISAGIFAFTLSWNEFIYALTFISSSEIKTVPVAVVTELVEGDVYHWGALMAGALLGSLPVAIFYSFFVEYYVSSLTGAVKE